MAYERVNWENSPSTATPLNATNLNKMDEGIANLDEGVANLNAKFGGDGILDISKGGTGNDEGYIQTGYKALSIRGNKVTIEGNNNEASADYAHAEGSNNTASRNNAHVEGRYNVASGTSSHAQGESNRASGNYSHAGGEGNVAGYSAQTVVGKYNNNKSDTLFEVGNGTSDDNRKNAFEVSGDGISTDNGITKIRFGKNDANQYGYYRENDPNLILFDSSIASCAGIGKKTGVNSSGVIDTDIILGRNPEKGDRFLVYFDSKVDNANSMKIYVTSGSFVTPSLFEGGLIPPEYYLNGLCLFEYKVDNILSSYYLDLIYRKEDKSYTAGRGININNDTIANSMPQLGDNVQCKSVDSVTQGRLGSYSGNVKYLLIHFDTDAESYNGAYSLVLSYSGSVAVMKYATLYDRVMGMEYDREIYSGSTLLCEIMDEGTGTEADPIHVDVLGVIDGYVTAGWGRQAALGDRATAEGIGTEASGNYAHAQGYQTTASGNQSTAMGYSTTASADGATAMGNGSTASGANSLAQGYNTTASGAVSTAIGTNTQATQQAQFAAGKYNHVNNDALIMVGNGTSENARSNALEVLLNGDVVAGNEIIDGQGNTLSVLAEALTKTASGNPVVISDCAGGKARSLKTTIEAIQDLHGYDKPWAGGAGKNLSPVENGNNLVLCAVESGVTYTFSLTTSDSVGFNLYKNNSEGELIINKTPITAGRTSVTFTADSNFNLYLNGFSLITGKSFAELTSLFMVEKGSTATSYAPYSNICPISGRTEARVDTENEDSTESAYAVIQLGTTVYGAEINWDTGVATVKTAFKTYDGSETWTASNSGQDGCMRCETVLPSDAKPNTSNTTLVGARFNEYTEKTPNQTWGGGADSIGVSISSVIQNKVYLSVCQTGLQNMKVADFKTWLASNNLQVEYQLATPTELTLTPTQLQMLKGYNRVTIDNGTIELGYIAKVA